MSLLERRSVKQAKELNLNEVKENFCHCSSVEGNLLPQGAPPFRAFTYTAKQKNPELGINLASILLQLIPIVYHLENRIMSFIGSSEKWGDQATARLCQIILQSNDGMAQQIAENRTDLLDLYSLKELESTDDLGLSLPFLAVYYDQPDALRYLHKRGLDLSKPCDPMGFGTPYFYAVSLGKSRLLNILNSLLYSYTLPCETLFNLTPLYYASRKDDMFLLDTLKSLMERERKAFHLLYKNFLRTKCANRYRKIYRSILIIQRVGRGYIGRTRVKNIKSGFWSIEGPTSSATSVAGGNSIRSGISGSLREDSKIKQDKKVNKDSGSVYSASIVGGDSLAEESDDYSQD
jgi:hypothetical protein